MRSNERMRRAWAELGVVVLGVFGVIADLIFDVGLHKGEDAELYLKKGFRVVGVEANTELCETARHRLFQYVESGQLTIVNAAITEKAGPVGFYRNEQISVLGTTSLEWVSRNKRLGTTSSVVMVEGIEFRQLLEDFGCPYYLKVDIEGSDLLCVQALKEFPSKPNHISIESNKVSWRELLFEFKLLNSLGYSRFKVVDQTLVPAQKAPSPAKEGKFVEHQCEFGSSGLFGEEAPGNWLSEQEALEIYRNIFWRYWLFGDAGKLGIVREVIKRLPLVHRLGSLMTVGWYDTHATI